MRDDKLLFFFFCIKRRAEQLRHKLSSNQLASDSRPKRANIFPFEAVAEAEKKVKIRREEENEIVDVHAQRS